MATIVRVKRRRDEDPLEMLLLQSKRLKSSVFTSVSLPDEPLQNVFKFAGRVTSKDANVSQHVRNAIKKEKLEREYKQRNNSATGAWRHQYRQNKVAESQHSRFKVISKYRALNLECLDSAEVKDNVCQTCGLKIDGKPSVTACETGGVEENQVEDSDESGKVSKGKASETESDKNCDNALQEKALNGETAAQNKSSRQYCKCPAVSANHGTETKLSGKISDKERSSVTANNVVSEVKDGASSSDNYTKAKEAASSDSRGSDKSKQCQTVRSEEGATEIESVAKNHKGSNNVDADVGEEGMFCLVDMEAEHVERQEGRPVREQITCNSEPMVSEIVSEKPSNDDYVYDIYYTNNRQFDFRIFERDLMFEAVNGELMFDHLPDDDEEFVHEDDDDENEESNWRNDYPDEDPHYYETRREDYRNDIDENLAFETENIDQMVDWMTWRCHLDDPVYSREEGETDESDSEADYDKEYNPGWNYYADDNDGEDCYD